MNWELNSIRIIVQDDPEDFKQIIARLQPVDAGTVHQTFGYETEIKKLTGMIVGETDKASLVALTTTGLAYALNSPYGTLGNYYVASIQVKGKLGIVSQTIRTDLPCTASVYDVSIELYKS